MLHDKGYAGKVYECIWVDKVCWNEQENMGKSSTSAAVLTMLPIGDGPGRVLSTKPCLGFFLEKITYH